MELVQQAHELDFIKSLISSRNHITTSKQKECHELQTSKQECCGWNAGWTIVLRKCMVRLKYEPFLILCNLVLFSID